MGRDSEVWHMRTDTLRYDDDVIVVFMEIPIFTLKVLLNTYLLSFFGIFVYTKFVSSFGGDRSFVPTEWRRVFSSGRFGDCT